MAQITLRQKIYLILDDHSIHHSKRTQILDDIMTLLKREENNKSLLNK